MMRLNKLMRKTLKLKTIHFVSRLDNPPDTHTHLSKPPLGALWSCTQTVDVSSCPATKVCAVLLPELLS